MHQEKKNKKHLHETAIIKTYPFTIKAIQKIQQCVILNLE